MAGLPLPATCLTCEREFLLGVEHWMDGCEPWTCDHCGFKCFLVEGELADVN